MRKSAWTWRGGVSEYPFHHSSGYTHAAADLPVASPDQTMNYSCSDVRSNAFGRLLLTATSLFLLIAAGAVARAAEGATGSIAGAVTSSKTHNALQGATVLVPALNRSELTDSAGSFLIPNLPPGQVELVISYTGFDEERRTINVQPGQAARLDLEMKPTQAVILMEAFTVASEREGQALAITEQRNAPNPKNVIAFDEWGILPTQNIGELATRLPGITFTTDEDNLINNVSIRGQPSAYTRLNIDGMSSTGVGGDGRTATLHSFSGGSYEAIEVIAGQTPDHRADSLGGQLNLKTRSPLGMSQKRRIGYTLSGRYFPSWSDRNFAVSERPLRPDLHLDYTERFDTFGGQRNLGLSLSVDYQEVLNPHDWDILQYEGTTNPVAQFRDYEKRSGLNDRFISAFSGRVDYQLSPTTRVSLRFLYNAGSEPFFHYTAMNPFANGNLTIYDPATNPNGSIVPGYTADRIEFRPTVTNVTANGVTTPTGAAQMRINPQRYSFTSKNPTGTLLFEHNWGKLKVDHAYRWSNTHWDSGAGREREDGTISLRTRDPIGFILDKSNRDGRVFTQTGGPSVYDIRSYTPYYTASTSATQPVPQTSVVFNKRDTITDTNEVSANVNATYTLETRIPITLKAGLDTVNRRVNSRQVYPRRWYQIPGTVLPTDGLMPLTEFEIQNGGQRLPVLDPAAISTTLNNPALWYEDVNFTATSQYSGRYILEEGVDAAYLQGQAKLGRLTALTGARREWVNTEVFTYYRARTTPIAAEPDHFKRAALDYGRESRDGSYAKWFPSLILAYDVTSNLKVRGSWTTSYGRPRRQELVPTPTFNDAAQTVTIGNASLKPQMAKNLDAKIEYYYGSTGMISVGWYYKRISDYITSATRSGVIVPKGPDNGFDGLYENYEIIQPGNAGRATLRGVEIDFRQRLTFLPGALKGLTLRGNYTYLETFGNVVAPGTAVNVNTYLSTGQIPDFVPRAGNLGLTYTYHKFGASFDVNYTGRYPIVYSTNPTSSRFREPWTRMNVGVSYEVFRDTTLFVNVNNVNEETRNEYIYDPSRPRSEWHVPRAVKFGITGRF
jgi:TonB-dependent receptor